ncbi:beta strand repeat-containing protein [Entomobacter blattae]|uniref:Uncharacterized protein n=1 Tax=Entomobacter blattae TaxID=2762277 RepID=A0A7H1NQX6_9PROT|nr:hypothetical protein [Entomobacter blattae]QNT78186.1 hypothetical protein JGUZn3_09550 [Entomobacter blattae]
MTDYFYTGGDQSFTLPDSDNYINTLPDATGTITLSGGGTSGRVTIIGNESAGPIAIDAGTLTAVAFNVLGLGNGSFLNIGAGHATTDFRTQGISAENKITVYDNGGDTTSTDPRSITALFSTLILDGDQGPTDTNITDIGGNEVWANSGTTTYNILTDTASLFPSHLYASKSTGTFVIGNSANTSADSSTTSPSAANPVANDSPAALNVVLTVADSTTPLDYTVTQNSDATISLFQQQGTLTFTGQNTTLVLNGENADVTSTLTLGDNNTIWAGNGSSTVTVNGTNNIINTAGTGDINIQAGSSQVADSHLSILGAGDTTGQTAYQQGLEDVTVSGMHNNFIAALGTGTADIDVGTFSANGSPYRYGLELASNLGGGNIENIIIRNFTASQATDPTSQNIIGVGASTTVTSSYDGTDTIFTLADGTIGTVTFTGVDLQGIDPFTRGTTFSDILQSSSNALIAA